MIRPRVAGWALGLYTLVVFSLAFWRWSPTATMPVINLRPLSGIGESLAAGGRATLINVVGNIVVFAPIGLLLPLWRKSGRSWWRSALAGMALSLAIELLQWWLGYRVTDIDDIVLNTFGTVIGYSLFWLCTQSKFRLVNQTDRQRRN